MQGGHIHSSHTAPEADAILPTKFGDFRIRAFRDPIDGKEHCVLYLEIFPRVPPSFAFILSVLQAMLSHHFDAMRPPTPRLDESHSGTRSGAIAYMRQEGRGIGLYSKMQAYALQDTGLDTLDANLALGLPADARKYDFAAEMLYTMGVSSVELATNNPDKRDQLLDQGIEVTNRIPIIVGQCAHNRHYMRTKGARMGHILPN